MKITLSATLAMLFTGASSWLLLASNKVSTDQMAVYVESRSPWVIERGEITAAVAGNVKNIDRLGALCEKLLDAQQELMVQQRVTITRIEALIDKNR